jgi:hypothetical protein
MIAVAQQSAPTPNDDGERRPMSTLKSHWPTVLVTIFAVLFFLFGQSWIDAAAGWDAKAKAEYAHQLELNRQVLELNQKIEEVTLIRCMRVIGRPCTAEEVKDMRRTAR